MTWASDPNHLHVGFAGKHLGIVSVKGFFRKAEVTLNLEDPDPTRWSVAARIDVASLDTNNDIRDRKLKGPRYVDADQFPTMVFQSLRVEAASDGSYSVVGLLTLHGVTREVCLRTRLNGEVVDSRGRGCRGFSAETLLSLQDFRIHEPIEPADEAEGDPANDHIQVSIEAKAIDRQPGDQDGPPIRRSRERSAALMDDHASE